MSSLITAANVVRLTPPQTVVTTERIITTLGSLGAPGSAVIFIERVTPAPVPPPAPSPAPSPSPEPEPIPEHHCYAYIRVVSGALEPWVSLGTGWVRRTDEPLTLWASAPTYSFDWLPPCA